MINQQSCPFSTTRRDALRAGLVAMLLVAVPALAENAGATVRPVVVRVTLDRPFDKRRSQSLVSAITAAIAGSLPASPAVIWVHVLAPPVSWAAQR
jgi:phenylpyruvate tautomerase PptA (4-oxalocrotonate tautomerase family)